MTKNTEPQGRPHIFVIRGDLLRVAADAVLIPTDTDLRVETYWCTPGGLQPGLDLTEDELAGYRSRRATVVSAVQPFAEASAVEDKRRLILTDVGGTTASSDAFFKKGIDAFVRLATETCRSDCHLGGRERPLFALPLIGTGQGGRADKIGAQARLVYQHLLEQCHGAWAQESFDLLLVLRDEAAEAFIQPLRRQESARAFAALAAGEDCPDLARAREIAEHARSGSLVVFTGAGTSMSVGLPSWNSLLDKLFKELADADSSGLSLDPGCKSCRRLDGRGKSSSEDLKDCDFHGLDVYGRASLLERLWPTGGLHAKTFRASVADHARAPLYGLQHAILARLPSEAYVTLNYDTLLEDAAKDVGKALRVLPDSGLSERSAWLLKLHGCIKDLDSIVLTGEDYRRYGDKRTALRGILGAELVRSHMLFVGFGLNDTNVMQVFSDVRQALRGPKPEGDKPIFGTALTLKPNKYLKDLWQDSLGLVEFKGGFKACARRLEIFLDAIGCFAGEGYQHLLSPGFEDALTPAEKEAREALEALEGSVQEGLIKDKDAPIWKHLQTLLAQFRSSGNPKSASPKA